MTDVVTKDDSQKTIVAFIVGLLIGGLLVWAFTGDGPDQNATDDADNNTTSGLETDRDTTNSTTTDLDTDTTTDTDGNTTPTGTTGFNLTADDFDVAIGSRAAGSRLPVTINGYPTADGWIGVRDYQNGQQGWILGVSRYSQSQGLIPTEVVLQRPMRAGSEYAIVFFSENGDRTFNASQDTQLTIDPVTFKAE